MENGNVTEFGCSKCFKKTALTRLDVDLPTLGLFRFDFCATCLPEYEHLGVAVPVTPPLCPHVGNSTLKPGVF